MERLKINNPFEAPVYYKEETESTMLDMACLDEQKHGTLVMAGYQKHGKGRGVNRSWKSNKDENLLFTIALSPDEINHPLIRIPLICGMALSCFLQSQFRISSELKWPNDILVGRKKISGILCEFKNGFINAGIGINCRTTEFEQKVKNKATSLKLEGVLDPYPKKILEQFLPYLKHSLEESSWKNQAEMILYGLNDEIEVLEGPSDRQIKKRIRITGLNDDGMLAVEELSTGFKRTLLAGEIRFPEFI